MADENPTPEVVEEAPAAEAPVVEAPAAEEPVAEVPAVEAAPEVLEVLAVVSKKYRLYNPFTKVYFEQHRQVDDAVLDGWLQSQLDAGYIVRV